MKRESSAACILLAGIAWRTLGTRRSGEVLIRAMAGEDEQNRMLAGMALVKAGDRTVKLIESKLATGDVQPPVVRLLPDLDSTRARGLLREIASNKDDEALSDAAWDCLDQLSRMKDFEREHDSDL